MKSLLLFITLVLVFASCAESTPIEIITEQEPYGFWNGLWHGMISPITLVISIFKEEVAMYAINNTGAWYNAGFIFGLSMICKGGHKATEKGSKCKE